MCMYMVKVGHEFVEGGQQRCGISSLTSKLQDGAKVISLMLQHFQLLSYLLALPLASLLFHYILRPESRCTLDLCVFSGDL